MKRNFTIRAAREKDYFSVNSLYRESYQLDRDALPETYQQLPEVMISQEIFINTLADDDWATYVTEVKGIVVGVINLSTEEEEGDEIVKSFRRASIEEFFVTKSYADRGIEVELLKEAEKWVKRHKITTLTMIPYSYNQALCRLLSSNGFIPYSVRYNKKVV